MNKDKLLNQQINKLVNSDNPEEVRQIYREWADTYDSDLTDHGYVAPENACALFTALLHDQNALIYDAGCGTGLVGKRLSAAGYKHLHGADFSTDMLAQANKTLAYKALMQADFSTALDVIEASYDAVISVGVYTARFNNYFLPEMIRILKPGGLFVFTCRELYFEKEVRTALNELVNGGKITDLQDRVQPYMLAQNALAHYISLRKTV